MAASDVCFRPLTTHRSPLEQTQNLTCFACSEAAALPVPDVIARDLHLPASVPWGRGDLQPRPHSDHSSGWLQPPTGSVCPRPHLDYDFTAMPGPPRLVLGTSLPPPWWCGGMLLLSDPLCHPLPSPAIAVLFFYLTYSRIGFHLFSLCICGLFLCSLRYSLWEEVLSEHFLGRCRQLLTPDGAPMTAIPPKASSVN